MFGREPNLPLDNMLPQPRSPADSPPREDVGTVPSALFQASVPPMQMPLLCPMLHASLLHSLPLFQQRLLPSLPPFFPGLSRAGPCVSFSEYKQV